MKLLAQLISHRSGQRSQVLEMERDQLATELHRTQFMYRDDVEKMEDNYKDYVLILMEKPDGAAEEYDFSLAPIMTVSVFVDHCLSVETQLQNFKDWETLENLNEKLENSNV